jgi:NO-binding membrane sensor protein with MHYT domain
MPPVSELCSQHSGFESRIETLETSDKEQWTAINQLRNRLPVWATLFISFLTFFLGAAIAKIVI